MSGAITWLILAAILTLVQWVPYIAQRALLWGFGTFLNNYPAGYPAEEPTPPQWAQRAKRAHLNMVETFPSFAAVVLAGEVTGAHAGGAEVAAAVFVLARVVYAIVYTLGTPYLRTPIYLVSWGAVLYLGASLLAA